MSTLVETRHTPFTIEAFARAGLVAWPEASKEGLGVLYAQAAGETGAFKYLWNWNLGNVKWSKGCGLNFVSLRGVWEGFKVGDEDGDGDIDADDRAMLIARMVASGLWIVDASADHAKAVGPGKVSLIATPANITTWFRAYPDAATGMRAFVDMKRSPKSRYASAWAFAEAGDCDGFARELGRKGYYTADPDAYSRAMLAHHARWMASRAFDDVREPSVITPEQQLPEPAIVRPKLDFSYDRDPSDEA